MIFKGIRCAISSVVEQCLDMAEVTGSNPVLRTIYLFGPGLSPGLFLFCFRDSLAILSVDMKTHAAFIKGDYLFDCKFSCSIHK